MRAVGAALVFLASGCDCGSRSVDPDAAAGVDAGVDAEPPLLDADVAAPDSGPFWGQCTGGGMNCPAEAPICCERCFGDDGPSGHGACGTVDRERETPGDEASGYLECRLQADDCAQPRGPDCDPVDQDHDGHARLDCGGDDCDDGDPDVHPGSPDSVERTEWSLETVPSSAWGPVRLVTDSSGATRILHRDASRNLVVSSRAAGRWSQTLLLEDAEPAIGFFDGPADMAIRDGALVVAAAQETSVDRHLVLLRAPDWTAEQLAPVPENSVARLRLALGADGRVTLLLQLSPGRVEIRRETPEGWEVDRPFADDPVDDADLTAGPDGRVHLAAIVDGDLWVGHHDGTGWQTELVDCTLGIQSPSIGVDANGVVHVAYVRWTRYELWYANDRSGTFVREIVTRLRGPYLLAPPTLATTEAGIVHVLFSDYGPSGGALVRYGRREPGGWSLTAIAWDADGFDLVAPALDDLRLALVRADDPGAFEYTVAYGEIPSPDRFDQDCDTLDGVDADGDGHASIASGGDDCDDSDVRVAPGFDDWAGDRVDADCNGVDG